MSTGADIVVYSPDHRVQLVVEVKSTPAVNSEWAAKLRQNLIAHGAVPDAPYFLIALPRSLYLWRKASGAHVPPDYHAETADVLREYLGRWAERPESLGEESLQIALSSWLRDLTKTRRAPRQDSEADRMLLESGAYQAIRHGTVSSDASP